MNSLGEKVSYIKGLAQGLGIQQDDSKECKILVHVIDVLQDIVDAIGELEVSQDELDDYIETIDEELSDIQNQIYGGAFEDYEDNPHYIEVVCPHCDETVFFDDEMFDEEDDIVCPNCHENIYTEEEQEYNDHDEPLEF